MKQMIAIVGRMASGKSTFLAACASLGFSTFSCDEYVAYLYNQDKAFIALIEQKFGSFLLSEGKINKKLVKNWIMQDPSNLKKLEKEVFYRLKQHLMQHKYDFVEIPILFTEIEDFAPLFSCIFHMQIQEDIRQKFLHQKGVDNFTLEFLDSQNAYDWDLKEIFREKKVVHISLDKRDNIEKISKVLLMHARVR
ncbi:dephospho-CoA kinase [Mycoplasma sp. B6188]|uniref:dephospho-CoA kinase n=1 Tax=Mycoplasma sp. B6188 TaxID=3401673 RepID=UPI003AAE4309